MQRIIIALFLFFHLAVGYTQSTDPVFRHITRSNGLPVDEVTCIAQDNKGFIWLGTKEGLYKYDGFSLTGFFNKPGDTCTLPGNHILRIYPDSSGLLWILTNKTGLVLMNIDGKVIQVINSSTNSSFAGLDYPYNVKKDNKGFFWCTTDDGLFKLKNDSNKIKVIKRLDFRNYHHATNNLGPFTFDRTGKLWICTLKGLAIYDPGKDILYHKYNNPFNFPVLNDTLAFAQIHLDEKKGKFWYSTWEPAIRICDLKTCAITTVYSGKKAAVPDYGRIVRDFFIDSHKNLWMVTINGAYLFIGKTQKKFVHREDNSASLVSNGLFGICEDKEGNFWFATEGGVSITRPYHQSFLNLSGSGAREYAFAGSNINFIVPADSNTLLIGSNGVYETDKNFKVRQHFITGTIYYDWVWKYFKDEQNGKIYISTQNGMLLYDIKTHGIEKLLTPPFNEPLPVSSFVAAGKENVWMSRYRNVFFKYNLKHKTFKKYHLDELGEKPQILNLFRDKAHQLWITLQGTGLLRFDEKTERIVERIVTSPGTKEGLLQAGILCLRDAGKGLFIGYTTTGFSLYNKSTRKFDHFTQADGLASNTVTDAIERDSLIWIATGNGISRFNISTREFINYNYYSGILHNNFETITSLPDGRMAAGSTKGMVLFDPDSLDANKNVPPPIITDLVIYGKRISADSVIDNHLPLRISYKENYFSVEYISLRYQDNQQIEYAYLLKGLDKNWVYAGKRRFASYSNLKGGGYYFRVRARLPGGDWVEGKYILPVIIDAAFYAQWWFYLIAACSFVAIVYGVYRYRLQHILHLQNMRTAISSDLHDEVGAALSSISIFSEMAKMSVETSSKAETYLLKIGDRSREGIEKMSDIIWSINPENDSLAQTLIRMKNYANELLEAKNIVVHWVESENLSQVKLSMPQRKNLYLLFKEVINNAAKYSIANNVYVQIDNDHKCIQLSVKDDGVGFDIHKAATGNGMRNLQRRSNLMDGKLEINSDETGTTVHLLLPV